jgi:hypothetical protein
MFAATGPLLAAPPSDKWLTTVSVHLSGAYFKTAQVGKVVEYPQLHVQYSIIADFKVEAPGFKHGCHTHQEMVSVHVVLNPGLTGATRVRRKI